jgi:hypothetical protein
MATTYFGVKPILWGSETQNLPFGMLVVSFDQTKCLQVVGCILGFVAKKTLIRNKCYTNKNLNVVQNLNLFVSDTQMVWFACCYDGELGVCLFAYCLLFFIGDRIERQRVHRGGGGL